MSELPHRRILYVGPDIAGSTTLQRLSALRELGHEIAFVPTVKRDPSNAVRPSIFARVRRKMFGPQDETAANSGILAAIRQTQFDIIWIDKGLTIQPETLKAIRAIQPNSRIVGFSPDDMMNPANQSKAFLLGLPQYHHFITTKSYNVPELQALGCRNVLFIDNSYDPATHRPVAMSAEDMTKFGGRVGFIGQWEPERAASIRSLALAGIPVRVWGYTWERMRHVPVGLTLENKPLWSDDYAKAICAFDINLCFLRKCNRDLQTTRSMEIPACGAFMLAERTKEHQRFFEEGVEAEYFSDDHELLDKTRYYLEHDEKRMQIAQNGYQRCIKAGYSNKERLQKVLKTIYCDGPTDS